MAHLKVTPFVGQICLAWNITSLDIHHDMALPSSSSLLVTSGIAVAVDIAVDDCAATVAAATATAAAADVAAAAGGVLLFCSSDQVRVVRRLNEPASTSDIRSVINLLAYDGGYQMLADALQLLPENVFTSQLGDRPDAPNYAILITGGLVYSEFALPLAEKTRQRGIHLFGVGVGLTNDAEEMLNTIVAGGPTQNMLSAKESSALDRVVDRIVAFLCEGRRLAIILYGRVSV